MLISVLTIVAICAAIFSASTLLLSKKGREVAPHPPNGDSLGIVPGWIEQGKRSGASRADLCPVLKEIRCLVLWRFQPVTHLVALSGGVRQRFHLIGSEDEAFLP